ncbi:MAG TPA: tetratricopeptide repeat protein [Blastocatellia bacterium]|nr:tetratricopeptide repeat protein [Blastocatellia bacterium]
MNQKAKPAPEANAPSPKEKRDASSWPWWTGVLVIAAAGALAYSNSFEGPFIFDDREIATNTSIRQLWPPWDAMFSPSNVSRPIVGLSLALNYATSGLDVWSYHALNLLIHILAALALFGVVRRGLLTGPLGKEYGRSSFALALIVAVVWMVHPLQTQSVTYIIQRGESLMGLFYLVTLYAAIRSFNSPRKQLWYAAATIACAAGMLSKQVMITAPLVVLLYDRHFLSGSFKQALRRRWPLYAGLAACWGALAAVMLAMPASDTAGFGVKTVTPLSYFVSQPGVILHYLRLAFWPDELVLDYGWPEAKTAGEIVPPAIILVLMAGATVWALARRKPYGFLGAWFFLILSLTSSFIPLSDLAFEHRMYLPLASVVSLAVLGVYSIGRRAIGRLSPDYQQQKQMGRMAAIILMTIAVGSLTFLTLRRNVDYQSEVGMWSDVVSKRPQNARGHNNLGMLLAERDMIEEAAWHFSEACSHNPLFADAHNNMGLALTTLGKLEEGKAYLEEALRLRPEYADAHYNLGRNLAAQGRLDEAVYHFSRTLQIDGSYGEAHYHMGLAQERQGKMSEAVKNFNLALKLRPNWVEALGHVATVLATERDPHLRNPAEAVRLAERAVYLTSGQDTASLATLASAYAEAGRFSDAIKAAQIAAEIASTSGDAKLATSLEARLERYRAASTRQE